MSEKAQSSIEDHLKTNLESYSQNKLLNNLIPKVEMGLLNDNTDSTSSSKKLKRKGTPRYRRTGNRSHADSNIVTSPLKTIRRYTNESSDEYDTTTNYNEALPANGSKSEQGHSPKRISPNRQLHGDFLKSLHDDSIPKLKQNLNEESIIENDDSEDDAGNNTVTSDLPNDILSPEKHIYPKQNWSSKASTPIIDLPREHQSQNSRNLNLTENSPAQSLYPQLPNSNSPQSKSVEPTLHRLKPSKSILVLDEASSPGKDLRSPPRRTIKSPVRNHGPSITEELSLSKDSTATKKQGSSDSSIKPEKSINISRYYSSGDDEPIPKLSNPINFALTVPHSKRKLLEPIETSTNKKPKKSLYPTGLLQSPLHRSRDSIHTQELSNSDDIRDYEPKNPLYPSLEPMRVNAPNKPKREEKVLDKSPGNSDNWNKMQWKRFFKAFKKFEEKNHDLAVFSSTLLNFLQCDLEEILFKVQFVKNYENEIKSGDL